MESATSENTTQPVPTEIEIPALPGPWRATGWLGLFVVLHFVGIFLYMVGYSGFLGAQLGAQEEVVDPAAIQSQVEAHIQTPSAMVGMYMTQFCLLLPVLLLVAHFSGQSRWSTLGFRPISAGSLWRWLLVLALFLVAQTLVVGALDIEQGEFMQTLAGSRHLPLALMVMLAAPLLEELFFRGYLFRAWRGTRLGLSGTLLLASALFTAMHLGQYHWVQLGFVFVLALILGLAREKTGSILLPILLHAGNNLASAIVVIYLGIL